MALETRIVVSITDNGLLRAETWIGEVMFELIEAPPQVVLRRLAENFGPRLVHLLEKNDD